MAVTAWAQQILRWCDAADLAAAVMNPNPPQQKWGFACGGLGLGRVGLGEPAGGFARLFFI